MTYVIVGASLAGAKAAEALRAEGYDGGLVLIGSEEHLPYARPELSKGYLQGSKQAGDLFVHDTAWYADKDVDLRLGTTVTSLDTGRRTVTTDAGEEIGYGKLLLTTGATPRKLPLPGGEDALSLRTFGDSDQLRAAFAKGGRVVLVGGGWIGLETAAAAKAAGCDVVVVEPQPTPLHAVLGPELGAVFAKLHRDNGVELRLGTGVTEIRADGVVTDAGFVEADTVIVGIGAKPNVELAEAAGLAVDNGVLVDAMLQSSDPSVYAAGDVANAEHPGLGKRIRVEHWANAQNQGKAAGASMAGKGSPYERVPYFYTDQFDLGMEYSGYSEGYDQVVYRGDVDKREFIAFWTSGGRVLAGMNVNIWDVTDPLQAMVRAGWNGGTVDLDKLADPSVPLDELVP
jgi:3-phenylpropionate/trans-cinnamate dioxygenase ferredoxin reductase subunit